MMMNEINIDEEKDTQVLLALGWLVTFTISFMRVMTSMEF